MEETVAGVSRYERELLAVTGKVVPVNPIPEPNVTRGTPARSRRRFTPELASVALLTVGCDTNTRTLLDVLWQVIAAESVVSA
jgi:hypothetical protein